jgi:carotenoid 1,2-hydratase
MRFTGDAIDIAVQEICAPIPRRLRGTVRLIPSAITERSYSLDNLALHHWTPYAPRARIEVNFTEPNVAWSGVGYFDSNAGDAPLEDTFDSWTWSRASLPDSTIVLYDTQSRDGASRSLALQCAPHGSVQEITAPPRANLPRTGWHLPRSTRADSGYAARVLETFEDAPFYSRSLLDTQLLGTRTRAVHEGLSLNRFRSPWVQCLLPFRMPRITF